MKLTANERRALAEFKKPGKTDWSRVHGITLHALERKKLITPKSKRGWGLTVAGRAVLAVFAAVAYSNAPADTLFGIPALTWIWAGVGSVLIVVFGVVL